MQMPSTLSTIDVYAAYERTAPLEDLRFYLRYAEKKVATLNVSDETIGLVREMVILERALQDRCAKADKKRVWTLIRRFKCSLPGWSGHAGASGSWVEDIDSDAVYWSARSVLLEATEETKDGTFDRTGHGPVAITQIADWYGPTAERAARLQGLDIEPRVVPLTPEEVVGVLQSAPSTEHAPQTVPVGVRRTRKAIQKPQPVVPSIPCPSCAHGRLVIVSPFLLRCEGCQEPWELQHGRHRDGGKPRAERKPRAVRAVTPIEAGGDRTCTRCQQTRPGEEFCPGSHPNTCRSCRQEYRRQLAQRKSAAA